MRLDPTKLLLLIKERGEASLDDTKKSKSSLCCCYSYLEKKKKGTPTIWRRVFASSAVVTSSSRNKIPPIRGHKSTGFFSSTETDTVLTFEKEEGFFPPILYDSFFATKRDEHHGCATTAS